MDEIHKTVTEFAIAMVERQHSFFLNDSMDNSEHIPAIGRIADTAYVYLKRKGVSLEVAEEIKKELISHGKSLFVEVWMKTEEGEEPFGEEDREEAEETFDELLKEGNR
ncbi:MAG: hypothetical protein C0392_07475 [Syntrophus sp. (in: bacteria)]|nr:hypothetical protein [Syntrophus sp. (in: bacteria)]